jgi:hypothetical protein
MDAAFRTASTETGEDYLEAERELRDGGSEAQAILNAKRLNPDPVVSLLARVLLNWAGKNGPDYNAALEYLDKLPGLIARTPAPKPSPSGAAEHLDYNFKGRVADMLALRLIKEPDWPRWRVAAVLLYLEDHPDKATVGSLVRYAVEIDNEEYREFAIDALKPARGPDLDKALDAETLRLKALNKELPGELAELKSP